MLVLAGAPALAPAQVNFGLGIALPGLQIGINVPAYPQLVRVPDYPVYYAPGMQSNYFFYDGVYWVYRDDQWYASDWYNGPWNRIAPTGVPLYVLRVPVRYYRSPPRHFAGWARDAPPRWGEHWGNDWQQRRPGWDQWDHRAAPRPAPLPVYQRPYSADRYPQPERQRQLRDQNYRYEPREVYLPQHDQRQAPPVVRIAPPNVVVAPAPRPEYRPPAERGNQGHKGDDRGDDKGGRGKPRDKNDERGDDGNGQGGGKGNGKGRGD